MGAGEGREMSTVMAPRQRQARGLLSTTLILLLEFLQEKRPVRILEARFSDGVKSLHKVDPRV